MNPARTPLGAVFHAEVLFNFKRIAPYALVLVFSANAVLWWGWGPAASRGWATNSDYFIVRLFGGFSFMTLPLFIALMMGDPVIRDYRTRIDPLIFSKPVSRAEYLLGKFSGNFFVLVCCQACFALTLILLQAFPTSGMMALPARVVPYFKHFFFFVVISSLLPAAVCFTVGTLTRNVKLVYGLMTSFYVLYIAYQLVLKGLPIRWRIFLDPLLFNVEEGLRRGHAADLLNQLTVSYDGEMIINRALVVLLSVACLTILNVRFSKAERFKKYKGNSRITTIDLATRDERLYAGAESFSHAVPPPLDADTRREMVAIPKVRATTEGVGASLKQLNAALWVEIRLLCDERSLVVILPLATLMCVAGLAYYEVVPGGSYSAEYAGQTADALLLFLCALAVFYTGEAMHRDRELRVEPVLWGLPVPNSVLLLSKFAATLMLSIFLIAAVGLMAIALQIYKGHTPVEIGAYVTIYSVILIPSAAFLIALSTALNVLLRDKYLAYAVSFAMGLGLVYLFNNGYNHWLYNPVLYRLWAPSDLTGAAVNRAQIITHRVYSLAIATVLLALADLFFERKSTKGLMSGGRLSGTAWLILVIFIPIITATITGLMIGTGK